MTPWVAISCAHYRIRSPSEPQNTPQNTLRITSRNQNTEKPEKMTKTPDFRLFSVFFLHFGFGVYFGMHFGTQRGFVSCRGRRRSQPLSVQPSGISQERRHINATSGGQWPLRHPQRLPKTNWTCPRDRPVIVLWELGRLGSKGVMKRLRSVRVAITRGPCQIRNAAETQDTPRNAFQSPFQNPNTENVQNTWKAPIFNIFGVFLLYTDVGRGFGVKCGPVFSMKASCIAFAFIKFKWDNITWQSNTKRPQSIAKPSLLVEVVTGTFLFQNPTAKLKICFTTRYLPHSTARPKP